MPRTKDHSSSLHEGAPEDKLLSEDDTDLPQRSANPVRIRLKEYDDVLKYFGPGSFAKGKDRIGMSNRVIVEGIEQFFNILKVLSQNPTDSGIKSRFYFRGESTSEYNLVPSLLRDNVYESLRDIHKASNPIELQKKLLDRFRRYTQHIIHSDNDFKAPIWDDFDTLCLAQHFGLPTLLLDWTLNPYVAAYFAVSNAYRRVLREKLGAIPEIKKYYIRIWVMRLNDPQERVDYTVHLEDRKKGGWDDLLGGKQVQPIAPLVVVPLVFTRRIASQVGRFVYCGYMANDNYSGENSKRKSLARYSCEVSRPEELSWSQLYSLDVEFDITKKFDEQWEAEKKKLEAEFAIDPKKDDRLAEAEKQFKLTLFNQALMDMIRELDFIGFNAGRLFPDLEGWARYLREGNL